MVRASASLPVKPMSEILFWYIRLNPPFLSPDLLGALSRDGREGWLLPSAKGCFLGRGPTLALGKESGQSRSPPCRRAQPDVPFAVPEKRRVKEGGIRVPEQNHVGGTLQECGPQPTQTGWRSDLLANDEAIDKDKNHDGYSWNA